MPTAEDLKLRQEILNEWRAKTSVDDAVDKIRAKLGKKAVTIDKVEYWFKRFDKGDTSLFTTKSSKNISIQSSSTKHSVDSILVFIKDERLKKRVYTNNGRLAISLDKAINATSNIGFYDLFHAKKKIIEVPDSFMRLSSDFQFGIVGDYLLAISKDGSHFLKVNYETWEINTLSSPKFDIFVNQIIFDQLNKHKFLVYNIWQMNKFRTGQVNDDRIQLNDVKNIGSVYLRCIALAGNKLRGFQFGQNLSSLKFYEIDVDTLQQTQFDSPVTIESQVWYIQLMPYSWIGNRCYALFDTDDHTMKKILSFNLDTRLWSDTQITVKSVTQLFVGPDEILTLQDGMTFYRIALKKPESLKNLAWFTTLRNSKLIKSDIYRKIAYRLPFNCDLRCLFDNNDKEEESEEEEQGEMTVDDD